MADVLLREADLAPAADDVDGRAVAALRLLAVDMVEAAGSGHPGLPLGAAPMAWAVWSRHLRHDPADPAWPDRDRFVLSAGHGSALLYALLHLFGYGLTIEDLAAFRQVGSRTPGHPEHGHTPGVEVTTGPLGQGLATAVGLALAERLAAERFGHEVVGHRTFVLAGDGDLMEGVTGEASSLAGHLGLDRLVVLWDDNRITIDGDTALAFGEDVCARYRAYGWSVHEVDDGNDVDAVAAAVGAALAEDGRPGFVRVRTTIAFGAPTKAGTAAAHGAPLGPEETVALRRRLAWPATPFHVPEDVRAHAAALAAAGAEAHESWSTRWRTWADRAPDLAAEWTRRHAGLAAVDPGTFPTFETGASVATRVASGRVLDAVAAALPEVVGGSADLAESTNTLLPAGRHVHFGVREHAMAAALNGLALHGGFRPVGSTFLVFADYLRPALRLAALLGQPVVHVCTHDSIGLGEDGPTHQPVEHLASLRAIPNVAVLRPADAGETVEAWRTALARTTGPTVLALSRQGLPVLPTGEPGWLAAVGARVVRPCPDPAVALVGTGSEVSLCLAAADLLAAAGIDALVASVPWRERFLAHRDAVLPAGVPVVVVEAGVAQGWEGVADALVTLDRFGLSGPGAHVQAALGFTAEHVAAVATEVLA